MLISGSFVIFEVRKQNNTLTPTDMAKVVYKSYNQNDNLLFPHCIGDYVETVEEESVPKMKEYEEKLEIVCFIVCHCLVPL